MARSRIETLLPLEEYARIMSIPGWHFNQILHPTRPRRGCDEVWIQSGYAGDPNRIVGRDEVAQAIAEAERQIAHVCKFWPAPRWFCGDRERSILWPDPARGIIVETPVLRTHWGYLLAAGVEQWTQLNQAAVDVEYIDTDADGITDWARFQYGLYLDEVEDCEVVITPRGYDPSDGWAILPLDIEWDEGTLQINGPKWLFVVPPLWNGVEPGSLDEVDDFLTEVDVWRHWNNPYPAGSIHWLADPCDTTACLNRYQDACISILRERTGTFTPTPGDYSEETGLWTRDVLAYCDSPQDFHLWYYAGYRDTNCDDCSYMSPAMKRAIVSLANCYMAEPPCGCSITQERWKKDNEEQDMTTFNVAMANSHFGTSKRGAVYTYSVISRLPPLGRGG